MSRDARRTLVAAVMLSGAGVLAAAQPARSVATSDDDPRLVRITHMPDRVITVQTRRGQVTHIVLPHDEEIAREPATGQGSDCATEAHTWCVVATDGRDLFVKPKAGATVNNLVLVTTKRRHVFLLVPSDNALAALRVAIVLPPHPAPPALPPVDPTTAQAAAAATALTEDQIVANRLQVMPAPRNAEYSVATGTKSEEIVPMAVWDDGRFTYFSFPGHRPIPVLFAPGPDGVEEVVNARMNEDGLLVADRVARRFLLRLGQAVVAIVNDAYDADDFGTKGGTAVPGVTRVVVGAPR